MATAHYKCDACHIRKGYEQRSCKPSGLWSKSVPECVLMNGKESNRSLSYTIHILSLINILIKKHILNLLIIIMCILLP